MSTYRHPLPALLAIFVLSTSNAAVAETEFDAFKRQQTEQFQQYVSEQDRAFADHLRQHWEEFDVFTGRVRDEKPKPAQVPSVKASHQQWAHRSMPAQRPAARLPMADRTGFYGHLLPAADYRALSVPTPDRLDSEAIADAWVQMAASWNKDYLEQLEQIAERLELGDWGRYRLLDHLSRRHSAHHPDWDLRQQTLANWFVATQWGYRVKLAYDHNRLYLLLPARQSLYAKPFITLGEDTFYFIDLQQAPGQAWSYRQEYDAGQKSWDFGFARTITSNQSAARQPLEYVSAAQRYTLQLEYSNALVDFFRDYPKLDLIAYFAAPPSPFSHQSLLQQLAPRVHGLPPREALNHLLAFMHYGFGYLRDEEQFGEEKYLLPDESLHYSINDCEDRSILMSWLVRRLLGLDTVVLDYPEHIALAVALPEIEPGDATVSYRGTRYVITDPTYEGSAVGMVMPDLAQVSPRILYPDTVRQ